MTYQIDRAGRVAHDDRVATCHEVGRDGLVEEGLIDAMHTTQVRIHDLHRAEGGYHGLQVSWGTLGCYDLQGYKVTKS